MSVCRSGMRCQDVSLQVGHEMNKPLKDFLQHFSERLVQKQ